MNDSHDESVTRLIRWRCHIPRCLRGIRGDFNDTPYLTTAIHSAFAESYVWITKKTNMLYPHTVSYTPVTYSCIFVANLWINAALTNKYTKGLTIHCVCRSCTGKLSAEEDEQVGVLCRLVTSRAWRMFCLFNTGIGRLVLRMTGHDLSKNSPEFRKCLAANIMESTV